MSSQHNDRPLGLAHLAVLDLSRTESGAIATAMLAWLGANVVKIEAPPNGDDPVPGYERDSPLFALTNAAKRSVILDLTSSVDRDRLMCLVDGADALVEDWGYGSAENLGIGYSAVHRRNPALVYAQLSAFGERSRWASLPMHEGVGQATGGLASITGSSDRRPLLAGFGMASTSTGLFAALGVLAALHERERTSEGQRVSVAMQEAVTNLMRGPWGHYIRDGGQLVRSGNGFHDVAPMDVYPCAPGGPDDYFYLFVGPRYGVAGWHALLDVIERRDLIGDERYEELDSRVERKTEVFELISAWTSTRSKLEIMERVITAPGVVGSPVVTTQELIDDKELWARGSMLNAVTPDGALLPMPGNAIRLSECPTPTGKVAARGEHTDEVIPEIAALIRPVGRMRKRKGRHGDLPLTGVTVVDLTHAEAGPFATEILASLGADVIKVERPPAGDYMRFASALRAGKTATTAPTFGLLNANKKSIIVDLKSEEGVAAVRQLIAKADVFIENLIPGAVERMGFGYEQLRALNPTLVYAQLKGYPSNTRTALYPSFDPVGQAAGAVMSLTGYEGDTPHRIGAHVADSGAGLHAAIGILAALNCRSVTGRGQQVEVSMKEVSMNYARAGFARHATSGVPQRLGDHVLTGAKAPAGMYACAGRMPDDYCYVDATGSERHWQSLMNVIGSDDLLEDPRFATPKARSEHREAIDKVILDWTRQRNKFDVMEALAAAGIPAGAVLGIGELITGDDYWRQGVLQRFVISPEAEIPMLNIPVKFSAASAPPYWLADPGAHNGWFISDVLGAADDVPIVIGSTQTAKNRLA